MITTLLILHGLLAVALLGGITHQLVSAYRTPAPARNFIGRYGAVNGAAYTDAMIVLYIATAILGWIVYAPYRLDIRTALEDLNLPKANGIFEIKEHFIAIGLFMLPAYWLYWKTSLAAEYATARKIITAILAFFVWYGFLVGHILNNIKGFGQ
jgi:hypothetical protein